MGKRVRTLIFPRNWDSREARFKHWRDPDVQNNICPQCHRYSGRLNFDGFCQFCGWTRQKQMQKERHG